MRTKGELMLLKLQLSAKTLLFPTILEKNNRTIPQSLKKNAIHMKILFCVAVCAT